MKPFVFSLLVLILLFEACKPHGVDEYIPEADNLKVLNIKPQSKNTLNYSQFIDSIHYIPLETNNNILLGRVFKLIYSNERYFVFDETRVVVFDSRGRYLYKFGVKGKGPGEMIQPTDFIVDSLNNTVEILSKGDRKISRYKLLTGEFIDEFNVDFHAENIYKKDDNTYFFNGDAANHTNKNETYNLTSFDRAENKITSKKLANPYFLARFNGKSNNSFSSVSDGILFTRLLDNNIYLIGDDNEIKVKYRIDYGKYNLPLEQNLLKNFKYVSNIIKDSGYAVHFSGHYGNNSYLIFNFYVEDRGYTVIYNVKQDTIIYGSNVINNVDSGIRCSFVGIKDDHLIGIVQPSRFIKHFKQLKETLGEPAWSEYLLAHPEISKTLQSTSHQNNPILMLCYLKDKFENEE